MKNAIKRKNLTEEHKKKIGDFWRGRKKPPRTIEHRLNLSKSNSHPKPHLTEENAPHWKGDNIGVGGVHDWVVRWKGKPRKCESCGTITAKKYEWANINHKYKRVLDDYVRMCTSCHRNYDIKNNNYGK